MFHELLESLSREIICQVKHSVEVLSALIKRYEREEMQEKVYPLVPEAWHPELRLFTEDEFRSVATVDGAPRYCSSEAISAHYNADEYNPRDGELLKAVDDLAAYMEARLAIENGIGSPELARAREGIKRKYETSIIGGIDLGRLYSEL